MDYQQALKATVTFTTVGAWSSDVHLSTTSGSVRKRFSAMPSSCRAGRLARSDGSESSWLSSSFRVTRLVRPSRLSGTC